MIQENQNLHLQLQQADAHEKVDLLFAYMKKFGQNHYEEEVTQYVHGLQAAHLAKTQGQSDEMITAALLHDIGHMLAEDPLEKNNPTLKDDRHESIGAKYLGDFFPAAVTEPIRLHVPAKRYLCTIDSDYYRGLSIASQKSFHLQGGPMSEEEVQRFESNPFFREAVQLREWDDQAKIVGTDFPAIETYAEHLLQVL